MIKNTHIIWRKNESGSALVVTIMLTSVMLILAVVVLQRLIPYSRQVRNMQDSTQAYYAASSQVEKALHAIATGTANIGFTEAAGEIVLDIPVFPSKNSLANQTPSITNNVSPGASAKVSTTAHTETSGIFATINRNSAVPLGLKLYENDNEPALFGTSKINPANHTLPAFGSLTFDMTGVDTNPGLTLNFSTNWANTKLWIEFLYQKTESDPIESFFGEIEWGVLDLVNTVNGEGLTLGSFLSNNRDCSSAKYCSLTLSQKETTIPVTPVDFTLNSDTPGVKIPDLNTVIIADGLSENGEYHSRIIEVKEKTQGI